MLTRRAPLKRSPFRRSARPSRYRRRERHVDYLLWVKTLACCAVSLGPCDGPTEADHAGFRGLGQKAHDSTAIPLCRMHHRQRTDFSGPFRDWTQGQMREWLAGRILQTQRCARSRGVVVPTVRAIDSRTP